MAMAVSLDFREPSQPYEPLGWGLGLFQDGHCVYGTGYDGSARDVYDLTEKDFEVAFAPYFAKQ